MQGPGLRVASSSPVLLFSVFLSLCALCESLPLGCSFTAFMLFMVHAVGPWRSLRAQREPGLLSDAETREDRIEDRFADVDPLQLAGRSIGEA